MASSTLSIRVDEMQKQKLEALAKSTGRSRSYLAADAIAAYLEVNEWQVEGIKSAMKSLDSNGGVSHAEVKAWVGAWKSAGALPKAPSARKS